MINEGIISGLPQTPLQIGKLTVSINNTAPLSPVTLALLKDETVIRSDKNVATLLIEDNRKWLATQSGSGEGSGEVDAIAAIMINHRPLVPSGVTVASYNGIFFRQVGAFGDVLGTITELNAIGMHWNCPTGNAATLMRAMQAHMGVISGTVAEMRAIEPSFNLLFGGSIGKGTFFYGVQSQAQRTWGFRFGGTGGDSTDAWPSYHMGPIAMGGNPGVNAQFDPHYMLDIEEKRMMVRTFDVVKNGTNTIIPANSSQNSIYPPNIFDFPNEQGATISCAGIPGGTTFLLLISPISCILSASATDSGIATATITKQTTDQYASAINLWPQYNGAVTITRHNYINIQNPLLENSAALTDACLFRFDGAIGTHKVLDSQVASTYAAATGNATRTTFATGTVTLVVLAEHVKAIIDDLLISGIGRPGGWLKVNVNGTIQYMPLYATKF